MATKDKVVNLEILKASQDYLDAKCGDLKSALNEITEKGENLLYSASWINGTAQAEYVDDAIKVTATSNGTYRTAYADFDVANVDAVTISWKSKSSTSSGAYPASIRVGKIVNGANQWIQYITQNPTTIDTSTFDVLHFGLYVAQGQSNNGDYATFEQLQLEYGDSATPFMGNSLTAIDYTARQQLNTLLPSGNMRYFGERISLTRKNLYGTTYSVWKDFKSADIPDLANYELWRNQSIVIYNNVVFLFQASQEKCVTLDFTTQDITGEWDIIGAGHANSAQFTDMFFDESDTYPLLMISKCSNQSTSTYQNDSAIFYRVQYNDNAFTFTKLSEVFLNATTYGSTWVVDNNSKTLICSYYKNGNYTVRTNNPTYFAAFRLPSKATIIAGTDTTYMENDAETIFETGFVIMQGGFAHNGLVYLGVSDYLYGYSHSVWVYDIFNKSILSIVDLASPKETEGVCMYNNKIYVSQRAGSDTASENPLTITEYSFD